MEFERTRGQVERMAEAFEAGERYRIWRDVCQEHDLPALPKTSDTHESYCPNCCCIWEDGGIVNIPQPATH